MLHRWPAVAGLLLSLLFPSLAQAQTTGILVQAAGGVVHFSGTGKLGPGAVWGLSGRRNLLPTLAFELGYQGAAYTAEGPRGDDTDTVAAVENGGYAAVLLLPQARSVFPYAILGLGLSHINAVDEAREEGALQDDMVLRIPLGAGVDVDFDVFTLGLRATWDFVFLNENALRGGSADQLVATMRLGIQL